MVALRWLNNPFTRLAARQMLAFARFSINMVMKAKESSTSAFSKEYRIILLPMKISGKSGKV